MKIINILNHTLHKISFIQYIHIVILSTILFIVDKVSKIYIIFLLQNNELPIEIFNFFEINFVLNRGVSFSIFNNLDYKILLLLAIFSLVITFLLTLHMIVKIMWYHIILISCLIAGSIGNILDRVQYKGVVDFFHLHYNNISFPVFNVADCFITLCAIILIFDIFFINKTKL